MTINEVLSAISKSLTSLKGRAALDHYPSLRVKTRVLNSALEKARTDLLEFCQMLDEGLKDNSIVAGIAKTASDSHFYFRQIIPRMLQNFLTVFEQLIRETPPSPPLTLDELKDLKYEGAAFPDFNRLTTTVRQFIDNLVVDAYQFVVLEPKELAYQILSSLISFVIVAPASLQAPIVTPELQAVATEFSALSKTKRRNSHISKVQKGSFSEKAEYLCTKLKPNYHHNVLGNLNAVFSFCSEFTHVGYVPTLIASSDAGDIILGGEGDCYLPSFENLAKLRHQLLRECAIFLTDIYIPALLRATESLFDAQAKIDTCKAHLAASKTALRAALDETNYEFRVQPIAKGLKQQGLPITIDCTCGGKCEWKPPYDEWSAYCANCGARFQTLEVSPLKLYALSAQGTGDVIGAAGPSLKQLSAERRSRLKQIWNNLKNELHADGKGLQFAFIGNPDAFDDHGKSISGRVEKAPPQGTFKITAWVAQAAVNRGETVEIVCNCGAKHFYEPPYSIEVISCSSCGTHIGIYVMSGDTGYLKAGHKVQGKIQWGLYPLFGSIYKKPQELSKEQYNLILADLLEKTEGS